MTDWLMDPQAWIGLLTLTALEIVLGCSFSDQTLKFFISFDEVDL